MEKMLSNNIDDYEVLIRRRNQDDYASYCPQLTHMIRGTNHEEVEEAMKQFIRAYIEKLEHPDNR